MSTPTDDATLTDQPLSTLDTPATGTAATAKGDSKIDQLTGTTADDRAALLEDAKDRLSEAVSSAVAAVKGNPKTAAAIAAGATAAVAGAAFGAAKLAKGGGAKRTPARRTTRSPSKTGTKK